MSAILFQSQQVYVKELLKYGTKNVDVGEEQEEIKGFKVVKITQPMGTTKSRTWNCSSTD